MPHEEFGSVHNPYSTPHVMYIILNVMSINGDRLLSAADVDTMAVSVFNGGGRQGTKEILVSRV